MTRDALSHISTQHVSGTRGSCYPATHIVCVEQALERLNFEDMMALSRLFLDWAFNGPSLDPDQRTNLLLKSVDYEAIAAFCGKGWLASNPGDSIDVVQFVPQQCRMAENSHRHRAGS